MPLPIYLGYLNGSKDINNPAAYTATNFTNTTFIGRLNMFQPNVSSAASNLHTTARLNNGILAGFPANFWRMNPAVGTGSANMTMNGGSPTGGTNSGSDTKYDASSSSSGDGCRMACSSVEAGHRHGATPRSRTSS